MRLITLLLAAATLASPGLGQERGPRPEPAPRTPRAERPMGGPGGGAIPHDLKEKVRGLQRELRELLDEHPALRGRAPRGQGRGSARKAGPGRSARDQQGRPGKGPRGKGARGKGARDQGARGKGARGKGGFGQGPRGQRDFGQDGRGPRDQGGHGMRDSGQGGRGPRGQGGPDDRPGNGGRNL